MSVQLGSFVHAPWKTGQKQFECVVEKDNGNGTFHLVYDDGDEDLAVPVEKIKLNPKEMPKPWECAEKGDNAEGKCGFSNINYKKKCSKCKAANPNAKKSVFGWGNFVPFRRPKPAKISIDSLPTWSDYYAANIQPRKKAIIAKRHASVQGEYEIDKEINKKIMLWRGDITALEADAIVNAANDKLWSGGGICGAIHNASGPKLEEACNVIGYCETGSTVITAGFEAYAKHVLHSVGPTNGDPNLLYSCYISCLDVAVANNVKSVVFCCLSTGIFGFPNGPAAIIAMTAVRRWLEKDDNKSKIDKIMFCTFTQEDTQLYDQMATTFFPVEEDNVQKGMSDDERKAADEADAAKKKSAVFNVHDKVMCCDTEGAWLFSEIEKISEDSAAAFIHYLNYSRKWDEWVRFDSERIRAPMKRREAFELEALFK